MAIESGQPVVSASASLVSRLTALHNPAADTLVANFQSGKISEQDFIAAAGRFGILTRSDAGSALARSAGRFGASPVSSSQVPYDVEGLSLVASVGGGGDVSTLPRGDHFNVIDRLMR